MGADHCGCVREAQHPHWSWSCHLRGYQHFDQLSAYQDEVAAAQPQSHSLLGSGGQPYEDTIDLKSLVPIVQAEPQRWIVGGLRVPCHVDCSQQLLLRRGLASVL